MPAGRQRWLRLEAPPRYQGEGTLFGTRIPLFRLIGIEIRLDLSWILIGVLITWTLSSGVFPGYYPDLEPATYWTMGAVAAAGLFVSIILHELAHAVIARRDGLAIEGITLFVFGGVAEMQTEPPSPKAEFRMAIAGPIASLGIAAVCYLVATAGATLGASTPFMGVFAYLATINTILAVFNMVPAFPLDGGRVLRAALWAWKGRLRGASRITAAIGSGFGLFLIALGVLNVLGGNFIGGMWWFLIGLFVRAAAGMSYQQVVVRQGLQGVPVRRVMNPEPVAVPPTITIAELVDDYIYRHHFKMLPVVDGERLVGCVRLRDVKEVPRERWGMTAVSAVMRACSPEDTVEPDADALTALARMHQSGNGRTLVTENGTLVGIVTLKDMLKFPSIKLDLETGEDIGLTREPGVRAFLPGGRWQSRSAR
ncbi:MAG TPA: site-2 protease family protein [Geminicoccaceae bacterium]|nr:site-2 protease family protein [Geminicoccaceae bacterium]